MLNYLNENKIKLILNFIIMGIASPLITIELTEILYYGINSKNLFLTISSLLILVASVYSKVILADNLKEQIKENINTIQNIGLILLGIGSTGLSFTDVKFYAGIIAVISGLGILFFGLYLKYKLLKQENSYG